MEAESDSIRIEQLEIFAAVGVSDEERATPQKLTVTIQFPPPRRFAEMRDEIDRTLDYAIVADVARDFAQTHSSLLIETLASGLASHLLERFRMGRVEVEIRKFVLPAAKYVAVRTSASE